MTTVFTTVSQRESHNQPTRSVQPSLATSYAVRRRRVVTVTPRRRVLAAASCGGRADGTRARPQPHEARVARNDPFRALSHPIRRSIVERLAAGPATVGQATGGLGVSKPAITKHLRVLEETGVVTRIVEGRTHRLSLEPEVLSEAANWMDRQRAMWGRLFDVVDEYLKEEQQR